MREHPALREYLRASLATGATYRLRRQAWAADGYRTFRRQVEAALGGVHGAPGAPTVDVPLLPTLAPAVLSPDVSAQLRRLGPLLVDTLRVSLSLLGDDPRARSFIGAGRRAEADDPALADPYVGHWIRVDYAIATAGDGSRRPVVFDVNLMPGMTHVTAAVDRLHAQCFGRPRLPPGVASWRGHDPAPLDRIRAEAACLDGRDGTVTFMVRGAHGLAPDVRLAARAVAGPVVSAAEPWRPEQHTVVRQARRYSKHAGPERAREESSVEELARAARSGRCTALPGFHMGLESHAWPYFWQTDPYRSALVEALGADRYGALVASFPQTGIVRDAVVHWAAGDAQQLREELLVDRVVKTSDSTGAEGVVVLSGSNRGRRRFRQEAVERITADAGRGAWVVQDYVDAPRETFAVVDGSGDETSATGTMRYAAYYAGGAYLGGYALLSPTSRMVHGGSGTYWVPIVEAVGAPAAGPAGERGAA